MASHLVAASFLWSSRYRKYEGLIEEYNHRWYDGRYRHQNHAKTAVFTCTQMIRRYSNVTRWEIQQGRLHRALEKRSAAAHAVKQLNPINYWPIEGQRPFNREKEIFQTSWLVILLTITSILCKKATCVLWKNIINIVNTKKSLRPEYMCWISLDLWSQFWIKT